MSTTDPLSPVQHSGPADKPGQETSGPARVPPGQYVTEHLPVLHYGSIPYLDKDTWSLRVWGLIDHEKRWTFDQFRALPVVTIVADIHCVTRWSKLDTRWEGVTTQEVLGRVQVEAKARFVLIHTEQGYTANVPLEDFLREGNVFAWRYDGQELSPAHGWPLRLVMPSLYFWKSAKWVRGIELLADDQPGFWEQYGYHNRGDPWREERFG